MPAELCPWCGGELRAAAPPFRVERCPACGVGVTRPLPTTDDLDAAYGEAYRPAGGRFVGATDALLRRTRSALARRIDAIAPPGPVLDVGAGDGTLVGALRARGREAIGVERGGLEVAELDGDWAAVVFWHSLEHMPDPGPTLAAAVERLAPRGVVIVTVPNLSSLQARAFGDRWLALDLPRHVVHLPEQALLARLGDLGLSVERVSHWRGGQVAFGWLHGLVAALPRHPDLYDALRVPGARLRRRNEGDRRAALALGAVLAPVAALAAAVEVGARRGGSVYIEARRP